MTNKERQASLEKKMGENVGQMPQCEKCSEHVNVSLYDSNGRYGGIYCDTDYITRTEQCLCAKAYNRMVRERPKITTTEKDWK